MTEAFTTRTARRATAEAIICAFYARLGRPAPGFMWFADPVECVLACNILALLEDVDRGRQLAGDGTRALLTFKRPVGGQVRGLLWNVIDHELRAMIGLPAELAFGGLAYDAALWSAFFRQHSQLRGMRSTNARGALHAFGVRGPRGFMAHAHSHVAGFWGGEVEGHAPPGVQGTASDRLNVLQRACGWWSPRERLVVCSDWRPRIYVDSENALHNERGAALELIEHETVFAHHGVRIPREWIERPSRVHAYSVLTERDVAVRRAAVAIFGWKRIVASLPSRVINADRDPQVGTLIECDLPVDGRCRFLRARCGTGREVVLSVPSSMATALEANAWTYALQPIEYQLEARA